MIAEFPLLCFRAYRFLLIALINTILFLTVPAQVVAEEELLRGVIAQCNAALKKTDSMYVEFSWRQTSSSVDGVRDAAMTSEGNTKIWRRGDFFYQDLDLAHVWKEAGRKSNVSCVVVSNGRYLAMYFKAPQLLHVYRFENRQSLYPPVDQFVGMYPNPDILQLGFGAGTNSVGEVYETQHGYDPPVYRWSIRSQETDGSAKYLIRSDRIRGKFQGPWCEFLVNPTSGYLVTEYRNFDNSGELRWETRTKVQQLSDGLWFPKSGRVVKFGGSDIAEFTVEDARLNIDIPESRFEFESIELDKMSTLMTDVAIGGQISTEKAYWAGEWVPLDLLPVDRLSEFEASRKKFEGIESSITNNAIGKGKETP